MADLLSTRLSHELRHCVVSFLSVGDASVLMRSSRSHHDMIRESTNLWKQWCCHRWSGHLKDQLLGGAKISEEWDKDETAPPSSPDFYNILKHASEDNPPTSFDTKKYHPVMLDKQDIFDQIGPTTFRLRDEVHSYYSHFTLRSDSPLPRPKMPGIPFVWPFLKQGNTISLCPAHVSYYEITILPSQEKQRDPSRLMDPPNDPITVAIGLSFAGDLPTGCACGCGRCGYLPGWDDSSLGYHGDDGGFYYASSLRMRRNFGPFFGSGDTVGCGVDYRGKSIFFTLNGTFLKRVRDEDIVGHLEESSDDDSYPHPLFPAVGIKRRDPGNPTIDVNFGEREFVFDLCAYIGQPILLEPS